MTMTETALAELAELREPTDAAAILANIEAILPLLAEEAEECSVIGHLTDRAHRALLAAGVYRAGFPARHGGPEMSLTDQTRMVEMVATVDGGVSWNVAILAATGFYASRLGEDAYAELYPHMDLPTAGSFHPRGRADRVAGGYQVSGTWRFGSGIHSAHYVLGGAAVFENDEAVLKDDGSQLILGVWMSTDEVEILDDWHVVGLAASGSSGYQTSGYFVPESHAFDRYFEPDPHADPLNKIVDLPFYSMAGIAIGLSQHAVDIARDALRAKPAPGERELALLGEAESLVRAIRAVVYEGVRRIDEAIFTPGELPGPSVMARGDAPIATDLARRAVDLCSELVGSRLIFQAFPMERIVRDLVGLAAHASTWRSRWIDVGRTVLEEER